MSDLSTMAFTPSDGLENTTTYASKPASEAVARENVQRGMNQLKTYINAGIYQGINASTGVARQAIINGNFVVNQRVYVSNATLASGAYGHDRWKAGAGGGDYTFTQLASSTLITIKANKTLIQVIEDKNVIGGTYTLSWEGTSQARFGIDSATPSGAYAVSPITITTQTAGTVMSVEFNAGTLGKVQLNVGNVALPFQPKSFDEELRACKIYHCAIPVYHVIRSSTVTTNTLTFDFNIPNEMRTIPTLTSGAYGTDWKILAIDGATDLSFTSIALSSNSTSKRVTFVATKTSHAVTDGVLFIISNNFTLNAEL